MNAERLASCHAAVHAFLSRRMKADEFLRQLGRLWHGDAGGACVDSALVSIQELYTVYACALPPGAGYCVSEEQFCSEIQKLALSR